MRRLLTALDSLLLTELAPGVRLYVLVLLVLAAFFLGLFTSYWRPELEAERLAELEQEVREIRNQQRHTWQSYEALRTRLDRDGLRPVANLRPMKENP